MIHGSFTAPRRQELVTACGSSLELYSLQPKSDRIDPVMRVDSFSQIRALAAFRLPGTRRDYIVLTSDSGSISILSADAATATFKRVHCEPFGKSGCRRIVPGQFLACEPRGRACMVGALEKQKFAYVLNRDAEENLTISSPLEAHKSNFATFAMTSLDVGFENPMFAALERSYEQGAEKVLVYYELDLGLNHVVRKLVSKVRTSSSFLLPVPGHSDGPGGVLVCSFGYVTYRSLLDEDDKGRLLSLIGTEKSNGVETGPGNHVSDDCNGRLEAKLPFREGTDPDAGMIVSGTAYQGKKDTTFFFLLCNEYGDLIKVELNWDEEHGATGLRLAYFDTIPAPALDMCIFSSGYLAVAVEGSDTLLLKFRQIDVPDDDPAGGLSVSSPKKSLSHQDGDQMDVDSAPNGTDSHMNGALPSNSTPSRRPGDERLAPKLKFKPRKRLSYLSIANANVIESLAPVTGLCVGRTQGDSSNALICATGRGSSGSIRAVRRGIAVEEHANHPLPFRLTDVFTLKDRIDSINHRFIVVSFKDRTKVLEVGETKVEEMMSSGFELNTATLCANQVSTDSLLQIYANGVRFIPSGKADDAKEWKPPVPSRIVAACCNNEQAVVALSSGTLVYFEIDSQSGSLQEIEKLPDVLVPSGGDETVTLGAGDEGAIPALAIPKIPPGRRRSGFFVAGDAATSKVRLFRIGQDGAIETLGLHIAPAPIKSLALVDFGIIEKDAVEAAIGTRKKSQASGTIYEPNLALHIGTTQGALIRLSVDAVTGNMSNRTSMFLGPDPVQVEELQIAGIPICIAMGTKPWLLYRQGGRIEISPLSTDPMEHASSFSTEQSPDGFVTSSGSNLRLLAIDLIHALINSALLPHGISSMSVPSQTLIGCSFNMARTRTDGTPRRIFRLIPGRKRMGGGNSDLQGCEDLFISVEADHRTCLSSKRSTNAAENCTDGAPGTKTPRGTRTVPAGLGSWYSRLQLLKLCASQDDFEEDEDGEDDDELDGSDPFVNVNPKSVNVLDSLSLPDRNTCVLSAISCPLLGPQNADPTALSYVVVSISSNLVVSATSPHAATDRKRMGQDGQSMSCSLWVFKVDRESLRLVLLHKTPIAHPVHAMAAFRDMLLVGIGPTLRLYDLGKKQLLRKGEYRLAVENKVSCIAVAGGDRVFVGDMQESVTLFKYIRPGLLVSRSSHGGQPSREGGRFVAIASDILPRWVISLEVLDYSTVCGSDKFGNIFVLRLPPELAGATEEFGGVSYTERSSLGSGSRNAQHNLSLEACIHVGSTVVGLTTGSVRGRSLPLSTGDVEGNDDAIIYSTINGALGILCPLKFRGDVDFVSSLEREVRKKFFKSVSGRDHMTYRSSFYPVKNVVDGDLCEAFSGLSHAEQEKCAEGLSRQREDVIRKLDELRSAVL